ncbi:MAG: dihydroorotate dehydrogenase electron transfer subunit [Deltaproteobacteria bacterium]|nr:dihydroorotate dehydrogenase electron transfer subunit [Deltaproteobacteria bacterium]
MSSATIINNSRLGGRFFRLSLRWKCGGVLPGQFVMLRVSNSLDPFLRRPFGIYDFSGDVLDILYKVVGKGTGMLSTLAPGTDVDILGPLGNGFPPAGKGKNPIMVAGGIGIAPFYLFAGEVKEGKPSLFYGAKGRDEVALLKDFKSRGLKLNIRVSTEDGSIGRKGLVTDILKERLGEDSVVYACGPAGMLKEVSNIARKRGVKCYVSLERAMACGIGVCLGCAVKTRKHPPASAYRMVCSDGPVFNGEEIDWGCF